MYPAFSLGLTRMEADCFVFLVSGIFTEKVVNMCRYPSHITRSFTWDRVTLTDCTTRS